MSGGDKPSVMRRQKAATAALLAGVVFAMIGASFAAVPLYRIFCSATGYGGTTQRAAAPQGDIAAALVTVRFDATTSPDLDWEFVPEETAVEVHPGETKVATYRAVNRSREALTGVYFNKVQCFCFTKQHLKPGESAELSVAFFVDPDILSDPSTSDVKTITLSYSMFRAKDEASPALAKPLAQRRDSGPSQPSSVN